MAKRKSSRFVCSNCGADFPVWSGKCSNCGEWNTLVEQLTESSLSAAAKKGTRLTPEPISVSASKSEVRLKTNMKEVDEVLGGGFVPGSVTLIAGQPGIGKSTLLLQVAYLCATKNKVLYVSGEESLHQVGMRAKRLGTAHPNLLLANSNSANDIGATIATGEYSLVIVDSIQTITCEEIASAAGTVSQITNSTYLMSAAAKSSSTALVIVGHVTKEGSIAGPKVLEHVVDTVLQLEGDRYGGFKVLRSVKNRFGSTNEAGIFEMRETGLLPVDNPSAALLAERLDIDGSVVLATIEGSRPLLVEVQALVNRSSFGYPKRAASGFDLNRLNLLVAMLERRTKLTLSDQDIYVNIVGGIKINDPGADLAVCMAIASASKGMKLNKSAVVFGEVGLSGEIRHVPQIEKRAYEASKLGFKVAIGPVVKGKKIPLYHPVSDIKDTLNTFLA